MRILLQIINKSDSLDSLIQTSSQEENLLPYILIGVLLFGLMIWGFIASKSTKPDKNRVKHNYSTSTSEVKKVNQPALNEIKITHDITPAKEPSKPKYIGYTPVNLFEQTEPLKFPYVIVPKPNSVIKFPQKGRSGRKGYKEEDFKKYLTAFFSKAFQFYDDRFILIKGNNNSFEPDFTLIDEKDGINIFLDVEIDEPYEGINDISKRKATHYQLVDANRNNAFKSRGWIVIRFAEIQVHKNPEGCCLFIADVIKNIHPQYNIPDALLSAKQIIPVQQWSKEEAERMSREKYREKYLGIESFGFVIETEKPIAEETELGKEIEEVVKDEPLVTAPKAKGYLSNDILLRSQYVSFTYESNATIVKPITTQNGVLKAYCYVKNFERNFEIEKIKNPISKQKPFTLEATGPNLGVERVKTIVNTAIQYNKFVRMRYTRSEWTNYNIDTETGEVIVLDRIEAEESIRTINNIRLAVNALDAEHLTRYNLDENYVTAYCNRRDDKRTFRFDRISEIAILDL